MNQTNGTPQTKKRLPFDWLFFAILFIVLTLFSIQTPLGISVFPLFIIFGMPALTLYWLFLGRRKLDRNGRQYKRLVTSIFVIISSFIATIGIIRWQTVQSKMQGDKIVNALNNYHSTKNNYPVSLEEMIPQFLINVPYTYIGYGNVKFNYKLKEDNSSYILFFPNAAVFHTYYDTQLKEWKTE
jgi:amino acid transporter